KHRISRLQRKSNFSVKACAGLRGGQTRPRDYEAGQTLRGGHAGLRAGQTRLRGGHAGLRAGQTRLREGTPDYEEATPDYEQDKHDYVEATPDYEQDKHDYVEATPDYMKLEDEPMILPPPPQFKDPDPARDNISMEDYDDIDDMGGETQGEEDYDDVA
ncbi:hypothetical protein L3Q82_022546, partial [Scortum barcoo]